MRQVPYLLLLCSACHDDLVYYHARTIEQIKTCRLLTTFSLPAENSPQKPRTSPPKSLSRDSPTPRSKPIAIELPASVSRKIAASSVYTPIEPLSGRGDITGYVLSYYYFAAIFNNSPVLWSTTRRIACGSERRNVRGTVTITDLLLQWLLSVSRRSRQAHHATPSIPHRLQGDSIVVKI